MATRGIPLSEHDGRPDYENEAVFRRGCLPPRSYYIPETALCLNGKWDFCYASTPLEAPEPQASGPASKLAAADAPQAPPPAAEWSKIEVPGHWQLQGWGEPWYTNVQFPIPVCPPHVPTENATGTYRRTFHVPPGWQATSQLRLRFDGVDSAYHVWVNGTLLGYAQGSRNPSEFDITPYTSANGPNEVWVRVY